MDRLISILLSSCALLVPGLAYAEPPPSAPDGYDGRPRVIEFDDFQVPAGYHVETRPRWGLFATGISIWGGLYMLSVASASVDDTAEGHWMAVPVIGPFAAAEAHRDSCIGKATSEVGLLGCIDITPSVELCDGIGQVVGASLLAAGLLSTRSVLVPDDPSSNGAHRRATISAVKMAPQWTISSRDGRRYVQLHTGGPPSGVVHPFGQG
jgi:hypothetical protein